MKLSIVPCELDEANAFVEQHHRHHKPVVGHKFSISVVRTVTIAELRDEVRQAWTNGPHGQCAVTALCVQDVFGGELLRAMPEGATVSHYWNRLTDGSEVDFTREQFGAEMNFGKPTTRSREYVLSYPDTERRYRELRERLNLMRVCGVAIIGRPVARMLDDSWTLEVVRVATDGTKNACSALYGAAWRIAREMGFKRVVTYTLPEEGGTSLRAAGWREIGRAGGGSWSRASRPRVDKHPTQVKLRWEMSL